MRALIPVIADIQFWPTDRTHVTCSAPFSFLHEHVHGYSPAASASRCAPEAGCIFTGCTLLSSPVLQYRVRNDISPSILVHHQLQLDVALQPPR